MSKQGKGRPQGAERIHICISLPVQLNNEIHQTAQERGMTISSFLELSARNSLHPTTQKILKAPRPLRARGYDSFRERMRRKIKAAGGRLVQTEKDLKGELSADILYRPSQLHAYLLKLAVDEYLDFRVEGNYYVFETVEWQREQKSNETKNHKDEAREKAYTEAEQTAAPETKATPEAQPTPEDEEAHQRYLDLAAKAEAEDDQKRRSEAEKKADEQEKRFRKQVMGLSA